MTNYRYVLPFVSVAPPEGYQFWHSLNWDALAETLTSSHAKIRVERRFFSGGEEQDIWSTDLTVKDGVWDPHDATFEMESRDKGGWLSGDDVGYIETHITAEDGAEFTEQIFEPEYLVLAGKGRKTLMSDSSLKYGNTVIIHQLRAFNVWVEGYPICVIDAARDVTESIVLINPFSRPAAIEVSMPELSIKKKLRVEAGYGIRFDLRQLLPDPDMAWSGQVYVSGRSRVVMFFSKHSLSNPNMITTLEHSEPFRGEATHLPATQVLRQVVGDKIHSMLRSHG